MRLIQLYDKLEKRYGQLGWWPAATPFEVMVGAILTQNTAWKNVEKAITNLRQEKLLTVKKLAKVRKQKLARLIKPSGYFNQKAERLQSLARYLDKNYQGSLKKFFNQDTSTLRDELLSLKGIGFETADSMLLYAGHKPVFVIDLYTKRIMERLGLSQASDYQSLQELFESQLPRKAELFNQYHALLVEFAKDYCRKTPLCNDCFLAENCAFAKAKL